MGLHGIARRLRTALRGLHRTLGLGLGALFALTGLSGSVLVFYQEIDAELHPALHTSAVTEPIVWEEVLQSLRREFPAMDGAWRLELDTRKGAVAARYYATPQAQARGFAPVMAWVDPTRQRVLRAEVWGEYAMTWAYDLHYRLLLGEPGAVLMGLAGLALLVLLLSGLCAWWPRSGSWRKALRAKPHAAPLRRLHDLHKIAGLASLPVLLVLVITGVMLDLPQQTRSLAAVFSPLTEMPSPASSPPTGNRISVDAAIARALLRFPDARAAWIETPSAQSDVYRVRLQQPGEPGGRFPHTWVWLDASTGALLAAHDPLAGSAGDTLLRWLHPLHSGEALGMGGRVLVCAAGLLPAGLFITGWMRQRIRRRAEKKARLRVKAASTDQGVG
jgi:uncharacterized iron-regulated membrane protein